MFDFFFLLLTCQSVWSADTQADGKQGEGVDEVDTKVNHSLKQHHHQP